MKKTGFLFSISLITLTMLSCSSMLAGTVWDDSVPPEQSAKILFWYFEPTSYNQISVNKSDFKIVTIPAGLAEFSGDVEWANYGHNVKYIFKVKDVVFSCKLEGGKEYHAVANFEYDEENDCNRWGIHLYNDRTKMTFPDKDTFIGFIPFNPPVFSN